MANDPGRRIAEKRSWRREMDVEATAQVEPFNPYAHCISLVECRTTCVYVGQGCSEAHRNHYRGLTADEGVPPPLTQRVNAP